MINILYRRECNPGALPTHAAATNSIMVAWNCETELAPLPVPANERRDREWYALNIYTHVVNSNEAA